MGLLPSWTPPGGCVGYCLGGYTFRMSPGVRPQQPGRTSATWPLHLAQLLRAIALLAEAEGRRLKWEVQGEEHALLLGGSSSLSPGQVGVHTARYPSRPAGRHPCC